jgi:hypothetical protein
VGLERRRQGNIWIVKILEKEMIMPDWILNLVLSIKQVAASLIKAKDWLAGKKTYLVGIASIVAIVLAYSQGDMSAAESIKAIVAAIMAMTIRAGVTSTVQKSTEKIKEEKCNEKVDPSNPV